MGVQFHSEIYLEKKHLLRGERSWRRFPLKQNNKS